MPGMSQPQHLSDCDTLRELLPAYTLGATDPEETALVERLLPLCPEVAGELDEYRALSTAMLYSAPASKPPAHLHDALMAAVDAEAPARRAAPPSSQPKPVPQLRVLRFNRIAAAVAAVAAALLIISNIYWLNQVSSLNREQQDLVALLSDQRNALASLGSGQAQRLELVSTSGADSGTLATVLWSPQSDTALLYTDTLPALSSDRAYQLWLIRGSLPISAGVFHVDDQGVGSLIFHTDEPMTDFAAVAISNEPSTGSPAPTSDPLALAQL